MKGKNNIISEINRIHQIMGVKNQISEQVLASTGGVLFRKLADELIYIGCDKTLFKESNNNIYLVGSTQGLIDYNPGAARYISNLNWSGYLCKLHPCGITEPKIIKGCDSILLYGNMFIKDTNFIQQ